MQPQQKLMHTVMQEQPLQPAALHLFDPQQQQRPQLTQPHTGLDASCGASPLRHTRVISCKTYLKRLNVTQSMSAHLLPLEAGSLRSGASEPRSAQRGYEPLFRRAVELVDAAGSRWSMVYEGVLCAGQRHLRLTSGWKDFVRAHKLRIGDSVTFERVGEERTRLHVSVHKQKAWGGGFKIAKVAGAQPAGGQPAAGALPGPATSTAARGHLRATQASPALTGAMQGIGQVRWNSHSCQALLLGVVDAAAPCWQQKGL